MKRILPRFLLLVFPLANFTSYSQNLTGIWRGYFVTETFVEYKFELQVQQTGNSISGVSYSYHTTDFYGKATLTGSFNKTGQSALIREIRTVELRMSGGSNACIMKCIFQYDRSGKEEFLEGTFTSKFERNGFGIKKGDDCGGGKVYLRKVPTSDFYIEPFLRDKLTTDSANRIKTPPLTKKPAIIKRTVPLTKAPVKKNPPLVVKRPTVINKANPTSKPRIKPTIHNNLSKTNITGKQIVDSVKKIDPDLLKKDPPKQIIARPDVLKNRENELVKTLVVNNANVTIKLYDNGVVDGDSISVYFDKKIVLANKGLSEVPLIIKLKMDEDDAEHELVMVALNLGRIPPNTSLMIVESGDQRFDVHISSNEQKNAVVRFKYQKPK